MSYYEVTVSYLLLEFIPIIFLIYGRDYDAKPIPVSPDQQQHTASITYRQMHEKQQELLQLSMFLLA